MGGVSLLTGIAQCLPDVNWLGFSGTSSSVKRLGDKMVGRSFIVARYAQSLSQRSNSIVADPGSASGARLHSNVCNFFAVFTPRACARGIMHLSILSPTTPCMGTGGARWGFVGGLFTRPRPRGRAVYQPYTIAFPDVDGGCASCTVQEKRAIKWPI